MSYEPQLADVFLVYGASGSLFDLNEYVEVNVAKRNTFHHGLDRHIVRGVEFKKS